ncbi:Septum formation protein Maf [compost metagenome]
MLNEIKGDKHQVITSVCILVEKDGKYYENTECDIANVYVKDISEEEILEWIDSGEAFDKAGGYGIQTKFGKYVTKIEGNYFSIVGLPINIVDDILKRYI